MGGRLSMKEKIIIFLVGLLLGSIISTGSIYVYSSVNSRNNHDMNMEISDDRGKGGMKENDFNTPPELPNNQSSN